MNALDYMVLQAQKDASLPKEDSEFNEEIDMPIITQDSTEEEILDYILLYLCNHLQRQTNYFKGGYVLMKLLPDVARYSYDIDFSIGLEEQYEIIKDVLNDLGNDLINNNVIVGFEIKPIITPTSSGGIKFDRGIDKKNLGIDIGWHDISYGMEEWKFNGFNLNRFSVERMLADKLSAIYSPKRFRRTKDLYDLYILQKAFTIDYNKLKEYIERRNALDWSKDPFREEVAIQYSKAYDKLIVDNINNPTLSKVPFSECMNALKVIVIKLKELGL